jgi:hypothetical protein
VWRSFEAAGENLVLFTPLDRVPGTEEAGRRSSAALAPSLAVPEEDITSAWADVLPRLGCRRYSLCPLRRRRARPLPLDLRPYRPMTRRPEAMARGRYDQTIEGTQQG